MDTRTGPDGLTAGIFGLAVVVGGGNFLAVRSSNLELEPFWGAGVRFGLASLLFVAIACALRLTWPRGPQLGWTVAFGTLSFALFYGLMYWALLSVTAGVATVVLATVPLATLLLAAAQGLERVRGRSVLGAVLAIAGIAWMIVGPRPVVLPATALVALLAAALVSGQGIIVGKRVAAQHPAVTNAIGMAVGAALLLVGSRVVGEAWVLPRETEVRWALLYLVTLGSAGLFALVLLVMRRWTASATSYLFVLFPVSTMLLEWALMGEPVRLQAATGAVIVGTGVWFGALSPGARAAAVPPPGQAPADVDAVEPPDPDRPDAEPREPV